MRGDSESSFQIDPLVVDQLACPVCLGGVRLDLGRLVCEGCGRTYPVVDGIPVLIADRAENETS